MLQANLIDFLFAGLVDESGEALAGGTVTSYAAGTTTLRPIYQNAAGTIAHPNPATLDARGVLVAYGTGSYKFVVKDAAGAVQYTVDDVAVAVDDVAVAVDDFVPQKVTATTDGQLVFGLSGITNPNRVDIAKDGILLARDTFTLTTSQLTLDASYAPFVRAGDTTIEAVEK